MNNDTNGNGVNNNSTNTNNTTFGDVTNSTPVINSSTVDNMFINPNNIDTNVNNNVNDSINQNVNSSVNEESQMSMVNNIVNAHPDAPKDLKQVEIDYKPLGAFKTFILFLFLGGIIAFAFFLPEISQYVKLYTSKPVEEEKITDGKLTCILTSNTAYLTTDYGVIYKFKNNLLESVKFETEIKGSTIDDYNELDKLNSECEHLKGITDGMTGVTIGCDYKEGDLLKKQYFELEKIDFAALDSAFSESGGNMIEYRFGDDMDKIESNMNASGYNCKREK